MAAKRPRVPLNPEQPGLNSAFASLAISGLPPGAAEAPAQAEAPRIKPGRVVLRRETAHRGGKTVIVVDGFGDHFTEDDLQQLARKLRAACGGGGTVKERTIEIQGDQPGRLRQLLEGEGFQVAGVK
jgi:translation initiation factor 1